MASGSLTESLRETLVLFDAGGTPWTTTEIADRLDLGRRSTYERLARLVEHGHLETKAVGASARVWWRPASSLGPPLSMTVRSRAAQDLPPNVEPSDGNSAQSTRSVQSTRSIPTVEERTEDGVHERELELYRHMVETVDDGIYVLDSDQRFAMVNGGFASMTGYDPDELVGARADTTFGDSFVDLANEKQAEIETGNRDIAVLEEDLYRADGTTLIVESRFVPLTFESGKTGRVGVVRDINEHVERERQLVRQRERLTALDELNELFRSIVGAVIEQSTRAEIEAIVCEHLAESASYLFAWIGDIDVQTQTVNLRTEAGVEGYLDGITISVDPADHSEGATTRAILDREIRTLQDIQVENTVGSWRAALEKYGFRSSAAIPIMHGDALYGVLNVYTERPDAFTDDERAVIGNLGEVIGHAIAAIEGKRALTSDEVIELEFRRPEVFEALELPHPLDGTLVLEQTVPTGDGDYLTYGTATGNAITAIEALVASPEFPHWESVTVLSSATDDTRFEVSLTNPPVRTTVAAHGGSVVESRFEDGNYTTTVHLPPGTDVRRLTDAITEVLPAIELVTRRQVARPEATTAPFERLLSAELTDRQRTALEAAFFAGFFEWPRDSSGEAVASSIGISSPTFHQHLRKAQGKVFESLFSTQRPT